MRVHIMSDDSEIHSGLVKLLNKIGISVSFGHDSGNADYVFYPGPVMAFSKAQFSKMTDVIEKAVTQCSRKKK